MSDGKPAAFQHADDGMHNSPGSWMQRNQFVFGMDQPFFTAVAFVVALTAGIVAGFDFHERTANEYWQQRIDGFLAQLAAEGFNVPKDILDHIKEEHDK